MGDKDIMSATDFDTLDLVRNLESIGIEVTEKAVLSFAGVEYSAKCPLPNCTSEHSAFIIWDGREDGGLAFWCRKCGRRGYDIFDFYSELEGLSPRDTAIKLGLADITLSYRRNRIRPTPMGASGSGTPVFTPKEVIPPSIEWQECIREVLSQAQEKLTELPRVQDFLFRRGLYPSTIQKAGIGFGTGSRPLKRSFGKLTFPLGLLIPTTRMGSREGGSQSPPLVYFSVKVRRSDRCVYRDRESRYATIKGSKPVPMILSDGGTVAPRHRSTTPVIVVESELDALLLKQTAEDIERPCTVIALGGSNTNVDIDTHNLIKEASRIFILMDNDKAGLISAQKLRVRCPHSEIITLPIGKDPTEAFQQGLDLQKWIHDLLQ